nr:MAG TPA: hypothetical protein [Caudoviricetes sp.]
MFDLSVNLIPALFAWIGFISSMITIYEFVNKHIRKK